jgi:hypothetical protein
MTTVRVTQEWEVHRPRQESILSGLLAFIGGVVAVAYIVVGVSLIVWGWTLSPIWCLLALGWFCARKLGRR